MTTKTNNKYTGIRKEYQEYLHFSSKSSPEDEGRFNWKNSRRERSRLNRSLFLTLFLYFSKWFESWLKTLKCIIITIIIKEQGLGRISREIREWKQSVIIFTRSASRSTIFYHFQDGKRKWKSRKLRREEKGWYERERERKSTPIKWEWVWLLVQEDLREKYKSSPVQVMMRESDSHDGKQGDCPLKNRVMMEETDTHSLTSYLLTLTPSVKISLPLKRERRKRERERGLTRNKKRFTKEVQESGGKRKKIDLKLKDILVEEESGVRSEWDWTSLSYDRVENKRHSHEEITVIDTSFGGRCSNTRLISHENTVQYLMGKQSFSWHLSFPSLVLLSFVVSLSNSFLWKTFWRMKWVKMKSGHTSINSQDSLNVCSSLSSPKFSWYQIPQQEVKRVKAIERHSV